LNARIAIATSAALVAPGLPSAKVAAGHRRSGQARPEAHEWRLDRHADDEPIDLDGRRTSEVSRVSDTGDDAVRAAHARGQCVRKVGQAQPQPLLDTLS